MSVVRHTRGAPAGIQSSSSKTWQRMWLPAEIWYEGTDHPTKGVVEGGVAWDFDPAAKQWLYANPHVPINWKAGSDMFAYPVYGFSVLGLGGVRWGIEFKGEYRGRSIAATVKVVEVTIPSWGSGMIIPSKEHWMRLQCSPATIGGILTGGESDFQRDDFTLLTNLVLRFYRDGASVLDDHPQVARCRGLAIMYEALI